MQRLNNTNLSFQHSTHVNLDGYKVKIHQLTIDCLIGIYEHEKTTLQPVTFNIDVNITPPKNIDKIHDYQSVFCYHQLIESIKAHLHDRHINLVESLAHEIALICFEDSYVSHVKIEVLKPHAISQAHAVGAELTFTRP